MFGMGGKVEMDQGWMGDGGTRRGHFHIERALGLERSEAAGPQRMGV